MSMWNRDEAFWVVEKLEPLLVNVGAHVALGGSVLYRGTSEKDLDLFIYPHTSSLENEWDLMPVKSVLTKFFQASKINDCDSKYQKRDAKTVAWLETPKSKRVDFFFLQ